MLLVSDMEAGLDQGAAINFVLTDRRVRFEISVRAAEEAGIKISSRLLSAALRLKRSFGMPSSAIALETGGRGSPFRVFRAVAHHAGAAGRVKFKNA